MAFKRDFWDGKWPFGAVGEPDDVPVPEGTACIKLNEIIASADEYAGEYSFGGRADTLPAAPGICVDEVPVLLPLDEEQAQKMIDKCEKSPFGHNMETKTDESVRKSWQLEPDLVKIKNPLWQTGVDKLTETIAGRLGYKGIPLRCKLYKLLLYGEGGHFLKHQDTEKEDGMIATLVVQPPSTHEGGDLVVYRNGEVEHRHDFGKNDATAPYFCHYAVHYADAEHTLEKVTKGYRLALVYSICLPSSMRHLKREAGRTLCDDLADAINSMGQEEHSFALLLSHQYTKKSIGELGTGALKGVDSARFRALEEANTAVTADKKLRFFFAKLSVKVDNRLDEDGWFSWGEGCEQALHWYTSSGEDLGHWKDKVLGEQLNLLNPGHETLAQLWKAYGNPEDVYTGNEGPIKSTRYSRFAIVAWPANCHLDNVLDLMSADLAVEELLTRRPVDAAALRDFLDDANARYRWGTSDWTNNKTSLRFASAFCELLLDAGDVELAKWFFKTYCPRLGDLHGNRSIIPVIIKVINAFAWSDVGSALLDVLGNHTDDPNQYFTSPGDSEMELLLHVADGVDKEDAKSDLLEVAAKCNMKLRTPKTVEIFWERVLLPADSEAFKAMTDRILQKDPSELGPFVEVFSKNVGEHDTTAGLLRWRRLHPRG